MPRLADYTPLETVENLLREIEAAVFRDSSGLKLTVWPSREPIPFANRPRSGGRPIAAGGQWGKKVFDCAWFLFEGRAPSHPGGPVVLLIDVNGELCMRDESGAPLAGLTSVASSFDFRLGKPGKRVFQPSPALEPGKPFRFWGEAGYNDLFGRLSGDGRVVEARVAWCDEPLRRLYYDVAFLYDQVRSLPAEAALARRLRSILADTVAGWIPNSENATRDALRKTARALTFAPKGGLLQVTAAGHAHLDLAWLWPEREGRRKAVRTLATVLHLAERYPEYRFAASQAQMFAWIQEDEPALFARIVDAVKRGVIEPVGDSWVEADTNIPGGESLIRQIAQGRAFFQREFGTTSRVMFLPDVFGYSAALPQLLRGCGIEFFMTQKLSWNTVNTFPHHSFHWEGLDGSRVLTHMLPEETYNSPASASALRKVEDNYREIGVSDRALMLYGIGDGGGGPGIEHLENLRRARHAHGLPRVEQGRVADLFAGVARSGSLLPVWRGELYLERHQGTLTTHAELKRLHRRAEILLREVEWGQAAGRVLGSGLREDLGPAWRDTLFLQFHDILPGSSIRRVYDEALPACGRRIAELETMRQTVFNRLADLVRGKSAAKSNAVMNSLPWPRQEWVRAEKEWKWCQAPSLGIGNIVAKAPPRPRIEGGRVSNGLLSFTLGPKGGISSLKLEEGGDDFVQAGEELAGLKAYRDEGDAWDTPSNYERRPCHPLTPGAAASFSQGPEAGFTVTFVSGTSTIRRRIFLRGGSPLVFIEDDIDWKTPATLLRATFPCAVPHPRAAYEIQFGWLERAPHENTSWDAARHECPHQQWVALNNGERGVAVLNQGKYGSVIKEEKIEMSLLRAVPYPAFDGKGGGSLRLPSAAYSGLERHRCAYALFPHRGNLASAGIWRRAREFNHPLLVIPSAPQASEEPFSFFDWEGDGDFDVAAFKPAEEGDGVVLRIVRFAATEGRLRLRPRFPTRGGWETDLLETPKRRIARFPVDLAFGPFEIKTLLFRLSTPAPR